MWLDGKDVGVAQSSLQSNGVRGNKEESLAFVFLKEPQSSRLPWMSIRWLPAQILWPSSTDYLDFGYGFPWDLPWAPGLHPLIRSPGSPVCRQLFALFSPLWMVCVSLPCKSSYIFISYINSISPVSTDWYYFLWSVHFLLWDSLATSFSSSG